MRTTVFFVVTLGVVASAPGSLVGDFLRGDANRDSRINIADALMILSLFESTPVIRCEDAADANDDGRIDISDAIALLGFLFSADGAVVPGAGLPGPDVTCDGLDCADSPDEIPGVLISEIHYNPPDGLVEREFVELYNRTGQDVNIGGFHFTNGITFSIPEETVIPAGGFVVIAKDTGTYRRLRDAQVLGPYEGRLSDGGERLTLESGDCFSETVRFDDRAPWPLGPDGYGPSLERIDYLSPADDPHSWRASGANRGTAGLVNSTLGAPTHPLIVETSVTPEHPTSEEEVTVRLTLDVPASKVRTARLRWEVSSEEIKPVEDVELRVIGDGPALTRLEGTIPPQASQSLVDYNFLVTLEGGQVVRLPPDEEPSPFLGYFVYDLEIPHALPLLWLFKRHGSGLTERDVVATGAVILEVGSRVPRVFARADVRSSGNGQKLKFLKGEEYREDRTLNIIPQEGGGGTGTRAPHMEQLGFRVFRDLGALAPRAEWFRVIDFGNDASHTQNVVIQQVNERFFKMNGLSPDGDIYKIDKNSARKQNNLNTGTRRQTTLYNQLRSGDPEVRRAGVHEQLDIDNVMLFSVVSMLIENWDGYHNNLFLYDDLSDDAKWKVVPWDLDQVLEECCHDFPITWPVNGQPVPGGNYNRSRDPGIVLRAFHMEEDLDAAYREMLREHIRADGPYTVETMERTIEEIEALLTEDVELQEAYLGRSLGTRRSQIQSSYRSMRRHVERRIPYLEGVLGE